jgi:hypothetical protein
VAARKTDPSVLDPLWPGRDIDARVITVIHDAPRKPSDYHRILEKQAALVLCPQLAKRFLQVLNYPVPWFHFAFGFRQPDKDLLMKRFSGKFIFVHGSPANRDISMIHALIAKVCEMKFRVVLVGNLEVEKLNRSVCDFFLRVRGERSQVPLRGSAFVRERQLVRYLDCKGIRNYYSD